MNTLIAFLKDENGAASVQYGIVVALVALAASSLAGCKGTTGTGTITGR